MPRYEDELKKNPLMSVERRQTKLQKNAEAMDAWLTKLLRAAHMVEKLRNERRRLLKPPSGRKSANYDLSWRGATGGSDGSDEWLSDSLDGV